MKIAILSAMQEECSSLISQLQAVREVSIGGRIYYDGLLWGREVVVVFSRWGKVASASTTVVLVREFNVTEVIFTGVAGAIDKQLNIGDVVIGNELYQHDIDARPMLARYEIPLLGFTRIETDNARQVQLLAAANKFLTEQLPDVIDDESVQQFKLQAPKALLAGIATGDQFITCANDAARIRNDLPGVACVEMEGGAVAQVCNEYGVSVSVIRTISDSANSESSVDFQKFVEQVASEYSLGIVQNVFDALE